VHALSHEGHAGGVASPRASAHAHNTTTPAIAIKEGRTIEYYVDCLVPLLPAIEIMVMKG
jgi:hypothetical protein